MIRHSTLMRFVLLCISIGLCTTASAAELQCGDSIQAKDVLVVDLEPYVDQEVVFYEKLNEQAGTSILITQAPVRVNWAGNKASTTSSAKKSAAAIGCDLLVLLGYSFTERRWQGKVTTDRWMMVHLGKRENP